MPVWAAVAIILWACWAILRLMFGLLFVLIVFIFEHPKVMLPIVGLIAAVGILSRL